MPVLRDFVTITDPRIRAMCTEFRPPQHRTRRGGRPPRNQL